jgi:YHS domain-containing protein
MKPIKTVTALLLVAAYAAAPVVAVAADKKEAKAKPYPLETCLVSEEKLGEMGDPYVFTHEGRELKLCCKSCLKEFNKSTAKYVAKVDEAAKKVKPYKLATCIVSDEKLGDDAVTRIYKGQEVKFCCNGCTEDFDKDPKNFVAKLEKANK